MKRLALLSLCAALLAAAEPIPVITGNTVVQDLTVRIGGERFAVTCLLRPGVDSHDHQPVPEDVRRLAAARLVIINGLGFEGWFEQLAKEARFAGTVVTATAGIATVPMRCTSDHDHGHDHAAPDPHPWNSIRQGVRYAENIRDALLAADPAGAEGIRARAASLIDELRRTDAWAVTRLSVIPRAQRRIVINHDALPYFARDYGFEVLSPNSALEDAQPAAREIAALVAVIRQNGIKAVFAEAGKDRRLMDRIASEAGVVIGGSLFLDGVAPAGGETATYIGMFRHNVETIAKALE